MQQHSFVPVSPQQLGAGKDEAAARHCPGLDGDRDRGMGAEMPQACGRRAGWGHGDGKTQTLSVSPPSTMYPPRLGQTQQPFLAFRPTKHQQPSTFGMGLSAHSLFGDRILGVSKHLKIPSSPPRILRHIGTHQPSAPTAGGVGTCRDLTQHQSSPGDWGHGAGDLWQSLSTPVATSPCPAGAAARPRAMERGMDASLGGKHLQQHPPAVPGETLQPAGVGRGWGLLSASARGSGSEGIIGDEGKAKGQPGAPRREQLSQPGQGCGCTDGCWNSPALSPSPPKGCSLRGTHGGTDLK